MVEVVVIVLESGQKVLAESEGRFEVRDVDFLVFFDHDLSDYLLEDDELSGIEDCVVARFVIVDVVQEVRMDRALSCQLGAFKRFRKEGRTLRSSIKMFILILLF